MRISRALALFRASVFSSMINLTASDLIFTEKCLQRTLLVCVYPAYKDALLIMALGIRKVDQLFWYTNSGMATHRRNCLGWKGVLIADTMVQRVIIEQKDLYL